VGVIADRVIGCVRCGKPAALVGDTIPEHEHCPWCRGGSTAGAPVVSALFQRDQCAALMTGHDLSSHLLSIAARLGDR
jgi:hypothetical protein